MDFSVNRPIEIIYLMLCTVYIYIINNNIVTGHIVLTICFRVCAKVDDEYSCVLRKIKKKKKKKLKKKGTV